MVAVSCRGCDACNAPSFAEARFDLASSGVLLIFGHNAAGRIHISLRMGDATKRDDLKGSFFAASFPSFDIMGVAATRKEDHTSRIK